MLKNLKDKIIKSIMDFFEVDSKPKSTTNPFANKDFYISFEEIFNKLKFETERLDKCTCKNTYVWIEKFKEDNSE